MNAWTFVFLAYGIVSVALLTYFLLLKRRLHKAEAELKRLSSEGAREDAQE
jgi:CcmD family protein